MIQEWEDLNIVYQKTPYNFSRQNLKSLILSDTLVPFRCHLLKMQIAKLYCLGPLAKRVKNFEYSLTGKYEILIVYLLENKKGAFQNNHSRIYYQNHRMKHEKPNFHFQVQLHF